jgi:hypothetical protein
VQGATSCWVHCVADPLLRRSVCAAGQPACPQVSRCIGLSGSDREFPVLAGRAGTQRARRLPLRMTAGTSAPWSSSPPSELHITRVSPCVARRLKASPSFMFVGGCRWPSLAVDGSSGTPRGHGSVMRRPGARWDGAVERLWTAIRICPVTVTKSAPWPSQRVSGLAGRCAASLLRTPDRLDSPGALDNAMRCRSGATESAGGKAPSGKVRSNCADRFKPR